MQRDGVTWPWQSKHPDPAALGGEFGRTRKRGQTNRSACPFRRKNVLTSNTDTRGSRDPRTSNDASRALAEIFAS
jgi:hypothetical protein